jgi:hypothetical protein
MARTSLWNAMLLKFSAVSRMTKAPLASEQGWRDGLTNVGTEQLAEDNPVKGRLDELGGGATVEREVLSDGQMPRPPGEAALRDSTERAAKVLNYLAEYFEVELDNEEPAGNATPIRYLPPAKPPLPAKAEAPAALARLGQEQPSQRKKPNKATGPTKASISKPKQPKAAVAPAYPPSSGLPATPLTSACLVQ